LLICVLPSLMEMPEQRLHRSFFKERNLLYKEDLLELLSLRKRSVIQSGLKKTRKCAVQLLCLSIILDFCILFQFVNLEIIHLL